MGRRASAGILGVVAALLALAAQASAEPAKVVAQTPNEIRDYWTVERMREARPLDISADGRVLPEVTTSRTAKRGGPDAVPVRHHKRIPKRSHGKVFFTLRDALGVAHDFVCSGTVVDAPNDSLVVTAGHCTYGCDDTHDDVASCVPARATNFSFVPAYKNGRRPFGEWPAEAGGVRAVGEYEENEDVGYDVGAADLAPRNGTDIEDVTGGRGIAFNKSRDRFYKAFGYPHMFPFNGEEPYVCRSPSYGQDNNVSPPTIRISCDMTNGASGGGWVIKKGRVASVASYRYPWQPNRLYGPWFGPVIQSFYDSVKDD